MRYGSLSVERRTSHVTLPPPPRAAGVGDDAVDERHISPVQAALADERRLHVARQEDLRRQSCLRGVGRHRIAGIPGRGHRHRRHAERPRPRNRGRLAARLERVRRVERLVLHVEPVQAELRAESRRVNQRRESFAERDRVFTAKKRHQLAVAPHVGRAILQAVTRPASGRIEIVAGQQRSPAPAEMMALARIENGCAAVTRALEMREEHNDQSIVGSGSPMRSSGPYMLTMYESQQVADGEFPAATTERPALHRAGQPTKTLLAIGVGVFAVAIVSSPIDAQRAGAFRGSTDDPAINYATAPINNLVEDVNRQLQAGGTRLSFEGRAGYLRSALEALQIPVDSQLLVFSRASLQGKQINEQNPRALFFNDRVALGWVRGGDLLEVAAHDETAGVVFYTLDHALRLRTHRGSSGPSSVLAVTWPAIRWACPAS